MRYKSLRRRIEELESDSETIRFGGTEFRHFIELSRLLVDDIDVLQRAIVELHTEYTDKNPVAPPAKSTPEPAFPLPVNPTQLGPYIATYIVPTLLPRTPSIVPSIDLDSVDFHSTPAYLDIDSAFLHASATDKLPVVLRNPDILHVVPSVNMSYIVPHIDLDLDTDIDTNIEPHIVITFDSPFLHPTPAPASGILEYPD
jgi:hypothetical protein